ncbi:MAG: thioredoxin-like domain-containing protein [Patescibacteria group bacterium]
MTRKNILILVVVLALIAGAIFYLESLKPQRSSIPVGENSVQHDPAAETPDYASRSKEFPLAQELVRPDGYLNADESLTIQSLVGKKVILVDFWTYSCINCQRTQPYLNAWYEKYADEGLEIIGVHTPEFGFEQERANVEAAIVRDSIRYPVVQDNAYATWDAYQNRYWPRKYLIDINGLVVYDHIGEGSYEETERMIQKYLEERKEVLGEEGAVPAGLVSPGVVIEASSPETYFGWGRNELLANGTPRAEGAQTLDAAAPYAPNKLYLEGTWDIEEEYAVNTDGSASIVYSYDAKSVYFVASSDEGVTVQVLRDGVPVIGGEGSDVDANGNVFIQEARMYTLIEQEDASKHVIEIRVLGPGLKAFTFTFG